MAEELTLISSLGYLLKTATEDLSKELSKVYEAIQKAGEQQTPPPGTQTAPNDNPEEKK